MFAAGQKRDTEGNVSGSVDAAMSAAAPAVPTPPAGLPADARSLFTALATEEHWA